MKNLVDGMLGIGNNKPMKKKSAKKYIDQQAAEIVVQLIFLWCKDIGLTQKQAMIVYKAVTTRRFQVSGCDVKI